MLTQPVAVEIDGDERRWNCEIIDQRKQLDEERQLLGRRDELNTKHMHATLQNSQIHSVTALRKFVSLTAIVVQSPYCPCSGLLRRLMRMTMNWYT